MATQDVNIGVNVTTNTTKAIKDVKALHSELKAAQATAARINAGGGGGALPPTGGGSGTPSAPARKRPTSSKDLMTEGEGTSYGRARGAVGTGAAGRDFANEAQGLGGLVRLYATYAANIFAVGAAFSALKAAADTTNLIRGLDLLGAKSGQSLGTLSKRLVEVTGGAISMREAMTATAQASSAGMTAKNIERLALVAKNASLALGISMPDALSRISRGVTKLEPELLDELGLFTKIGPATEKYALEIGKTAGSLSDFERRQAFANAVLEEGEKKFSALSEAAANPYDKLLASLKNILQSGGELINKILVPIVNLLSNSPTALTAVLTGIGYVLLKQAVPAIGELRTGLKHTAEDALKASIAFKESFGDEFQTILEKRFKIPDLQAGVRKAEADLAKLKFPGKIPESVKKLAEGDLNTTNVTKALATRNALIETGMKGTKKASEMQISAAKQEIAYIEKAMDLYVKKQALIEGQKGTLVEAEKPIGRFDPETIALQKYQKLKTKVDMTNAISNAAQNASVGGIISSWKLLNQEVADKGIKGFSKFSTLAQGGLAAVGTRIMGVVGSLGSITQVIGLVIAGFTALDALLSTNSKEAGKFSSAIDTATESVANVTRTIAAASNIEGIPTRNIANTVAFSNALSELSDSLTEIVKLSRTADAAAGGWDNFWDSVFSIANKDRASTLAKTVATQIQSSISLLSREGLSEQYSTELSKILGVVDVGDIDKVSEAFKNLSKEQQNAVLAIQNNANRALGNAGAALQKFKDTTDEALKAQKVLTNSFLDTSPSFKYGESLVLVSNSLNELQAQGPERVAQALQEISTNMEKGAMYGKDFVDTFSGISKEFGEQKANIDAASASVSKYQEELDAANRKLASFGEGRAGFGKRGAQEKAYDEVQAARKNLSEAATKLKEMPRDVLDKGFKLLSDTNKSLYEKGMSFIDKSIRAAQNTIAITIGKVLTSNLTGPQKLLADAAFSEKELQLRLADIQMSEEMLNTQDALVNQMKLANALQAEANMLQKKGTPQQIEAASKEVATARFTAGGSGEGLTAEEIAKIQNTTLVQQDLKRKGLQAAKIAVTGEMTAGRLGLKGELPVAQRAQEEELKKITDKTNASLMARQDILSSISSVTSAEIITAKQKLELDQKTSQQAGEIGDITIKIEQAESKLADAKKLGSVTAIAGQTAELQFLQRKKAETEKAQAADKSLDIAKNRKELLAQELISMDKRYENLNSTRELENTIATAKLDTQSQELDLYGTAYGASQEVLLSQKAALETQRASLEANKAIDQIESGIAQKREAAQLRIDELKAGGAANAAQLIAAETAELTRQETLATNAITAVDTQAIAKQNLLDKTKQINLEQERYNALLLDTNSFAESLKTIFGTFGESLGGVAIAFTEVAKSMKDRVAAEEELIKIREEAKSKTGPGSAEALVQAEENLTNQRKLNTKNELNDNIKVLNSSKKLFKEKSGAYKALDKIEKALHVYKMAMFVKETAMDLWATGVSIANSIARNGASVIEAGIDGVKAVVKAIASMPFPLNIAAGAATAAVVNALISSIGGKSTSSKGSAAITAEQRQETQGTAMGYDAQGQKVQVRRGVFGDSEAKSESIVKSLEIIRDNSVDGLSYDDRMLKALENLSNALTKTAQAAYDVKGLRSGSAFGTIEGKQSSSNVFGGKSVTRTIIDSGIKLSGTFQELAAATRGSIEAYEVVQTKRKKKSWFGSKTRTRIDTLYNELEDIDQQAFEAISGAFGYAADMLYEIAGLVGTSSDTVQEVLNNINIEEMISLRGLSGEEFTAALTAVVGSILDDTALVIFAQFEQYALFGEGMLETVVRVVDTNKKINQLISNIGIDIDLSKVYGVTEALADAAGSLEKFVEQANFFTENFLTEAERLAPVQKAVTEELGRLGYSWVTTREAFKSVVQSLDITTEAGQETFTALMALAPGFDTVATAAEEATAKLKTVSEDIRDQILNLLGTPSSILAAARVQTLSETPDELKSLQRYVFALEDVKTAEANLTKARQTEVGNLKTQKSTTESAITSIKNYIESIKKFKSSLLLGAESTLTPAEKYLEAKRQFDALLATASSPAATPEEQRTRDLALSQLEGSASDFLAASRIYNASSEQYTTDFSYVQLALTNTSTSLADALTIEERSLEALNTQITALETLNESVMTVAEAIEKLAIAQAAVTGAAGTTGTGTTPGTGVTGDIESFAKQQLGAASSQFAGQVADYTTQVLSGAMSGTEAQAGISKLLPDYVESLYQKHFGRGSDPSGKAYWIDLIKSGALTTAGADAAIGQKKAEIPSWVGGEYLKLIGRAPVGTESQYWIDQLMKGTMNYEQVIAGIKNAPEGRVGVLVEQLYGKYFSRHSEPTGLHYWIDKIMNQGDTISDVEDQFAKIAGVPRFALGTNYVPEDMFAQVHQGERIIPAADNAELMANLNNRNRTNEVLTDEIKKLNQEVKALQKIVAEGAVINAEATNRNTVEISRTVKDTGSTASHTEAIRRRTQIV